jgi:hypothetical protein
VHPDDHEEERQRVEAQDPELEKDDVSVLASFIHYPGLILILGLLEHLQFYIRRH